MARRGWHPRPDGHRTAAAGQGGAGRRHPATAPGRGRAGDRGADARSARCCVTRADPDPAGARGAAARWWSSRCSAIQPLLFAVAPGLAARPVGRAAAAVAAARRAGVPVRASVVAWTYVRSAERNERTSPTWSDRRDASRRTRCRRSCSSRWPRWSSARSATASPATRRTSWSPPGRSARGWNASAIAGEYLSAASFLGVAGLVMSQRRRHALVPGRLHRRLPGHAAVRGGAAAPLRRVHAAGLRRGPAALDRAARAGHRRSWS